MGFLFQLLLELLEFKLLVLLFTGHDFDGGLEGDDLAGELLDFAVFLVGLFYVLFLFALKLALH